MNNVKELFLMEYFKQAAALGKFCDKKTFDLLSEVFLLSGEDAEMLWAAVQQEIVADVVTQEDANRYKRILQLSDINDIVLPVSEENKHIINIKCSAIAEMSDTDMCAERSATVSQVLQNLHSRALQGSVSAMYILGTILCEGNDDLCVKKCFEQGVKNIEKAAHWGYVPAILTVLHYLSANKHFAHRTGYSAEHYQQLLYTFAANSPYTEFLSLMELKQNERSVCAQLLLELFSQKKVEPEIFDKFIVDVVYGDTIDIAAKEKLLLGADAQTIRELATILPMHLLQGTCEANRKIFTLLPFAGRAEEQEWLLREIEREQDFFFEKRKALCLCCQDRFVLDAYKQGFENMEKEDIGAQHVVVIDVGELSDEELQPNVDNVFVTNCKNNSRNLYLLILQGNIPADKIRTVSNFLQSNKREKFRLNRPSVTLDLGAIVPICFCDKQNADKLSGVVNMKMLAPLSVEERQCILKQRIREVHCRRENVPLRVRDADIDLLARRSLEIALIALDQWYQDASSDAEKGLRDVAFYISEAEKYHNENRGYGFGG